MRKEITDELMQMVLDSGVNEETLGSKLDEMVHDMKSAEASKINNDAPGGSQDDAVHETKGDEAAEVNNGGIASQIEYLFGDDSLEVVKNTMQELIDEANADRG
jgi:hypothetical protein